MEKDKKTFSNQPPKGNSCFLGEWKITASFLCFMLQGKLEDKEDCQKVAG